MNIKYIWLFVLLLGFFACDEEDNILPEEVVLPELTSGSVDFSKYVAVGASFTAGFTDGSLFIASQENSFPNMLSKEFAKIGGDVLEQPLMNDNIGGFIGGSPRFYFYSDQDDTDNFSSGPYPLGIVPHTGDFTPESPTTDPTSNIFNSNSPFTNMGVPGAKSIHINFVGYGSSAGNPYFSRMASSPAATILDDAIAQNPTFFTLTLMGGNDVLGYATNGGDDTDSLTPSTTFDFVFNEMVTELLATGAKGVVTNVPYVEDLPYFTTVPNNALVLDAATAGQLTGFFQAVAGIFTQVLIAQMVPPVQAQALAAQYAITFNEGPNRWIIDVPVSATNPLGFRQMTEDELLVLTIDQGALAQGYGSVALTPEVLQVLGILQAGGIPTPQQGALVIGAVNGIDDGDALDSDELAEIRTATDSYNNTIEALANSNENIALVNLRDILTELSSTGISFGGYSMNADLVFGGAVSLDGIHLTARGYSYMAYKFLEAIDTSFGSNFIDSGNTPNPGDYPTNYSSSLR